MVISLDIAIDPVKGDLRNADSLRQWRLHIRAGRVAGAGVGAPCETWSAARFLRGDGESGPKPLRSKDELWGFRMLPVTKQEQVGCANDLLGAALLIFF